MRGRKTLGLLTIALATSIFTGCDGGGVGYGTKLDFNGGELYYTENVTEAEATKLGKYLVKEEFFDGKKKTVQLNKADDKYQFRMVVNEAAEKDKKTPIKMKYFCAELSYEVFDKKPTELHMCDNLLKTLKVVQGDAKDHTRSGTRLEFKGNAVYYTSDVTEAEAKKFGDYLVTSKFFNEKEKMVRLSKSDKRYEFWWVVKKGFDIDEDYIKTAKIFSKQISTDVFDGSTVEIHLCGKYLQKLRTVTTDEKKKEQDKKEQDKKE